MEDNKQKLFDAAHVLFLGRGFKDTSIADIAAIAGVGVGSFYLHFKSKEDIFVQIYVFENENVKNQILERVDLNGDPVVVIKKIVQQIFKLSSHDRILQEWFNNPKLNQLISEQNISSFEDGLVYSTLVSLIDKWNDRGLVKDGITKDRIVSMFNALTVLDYNKKEIKTDDYQQLLDDMISGILKVILK